MAISTNGTVLARLAGALYNTQMSNATYSEVAALDPSSLANVLYARDFNMVTDATVATTLVTNLGLTAVVGLDNWVAAQLTAAGSAKGAKVVDLLNSFAQMTADATYGTAATAFNTKIDASLALSQAVGNKGGTFAAAGVVVVANATFTLTAGVDIPAGTAGNDTFNASIINGGVVTLNAGDRLVGGEGSDDLQVVITTTGTSATVTAVPQVNTYTMPTVTANVQQVNQVLFGAAYGTDASYTFTYGGAAGSFTVDADVPATNATNLAAAINSIAGSVVAKVGTGPTAATAVTASHGSATVASVQVGSDVGATLFVGTTISGTGIATGAKITGFSVAGGVTTITLSAANTGTVSGTLTIAGGSAGISLVSPTAGTVAPALTLATTTGATQTLVTSNVDGNVGETVSFTYNGVNSSYVIGATQDATADLFATALDAIVGAEGVVASPTSTVTVTSATAGTALLPVTFSGATGNVPTGAITTANVAGVTGTGTTAAVTVAAAAVSGIETVTLTNTGGAATLDATTYSGVTNFVSNVSTAANTFNDIGTADLTIVGDDIVTNGTVSFRSSDIASVTDALTLNIRSGVNAGDITSTDANDDWTSVTINSSGGTATATTAANVVGALDLGAGDKIQTVTINADDSLTMTSLVGFDTTTAGVANKAIINVTGDSQVTLGALDAAVESLNASTSTGSIRFTASTQTDFKFVGGAGDDRVSTGAVLSTSVAAPGSVNAGTGSADRLVLLGSTHVTTTVGLQYAGFEVLEVLNGVAVDMDHLATNNAIDTIRLTTGGEVNDMTATQALNITVTTGGNNPTLTVKNGTTLGNVDTVKITASDELAATVTIALGTPVLTGVEKLQLVATDNITIAALTGATSLDSITITGSKTVGITSGSTFGNTNQLVDASAATGVQTLDFTGATAAVRILGGAAADTITVNVNVGNVINGGGGIDTIAIGGSDGADVQSDVVSTANFDVITSFATTANDFDYNGLLTNGSGSSDSGIASTEIGSSTTLAAALAAAGSGNHVVFIATDDITGASETALDALVAGATATTAAAAITAVVANTFNAVAGLDAVLGATDFVLVQISTNSDTFIFRLNNSSTTLADAITTDEITLVGVFAVASDLVAADYI